jgi:hypothetical protein
MLLPEVIVSGVAGALSGICRPTVRMRIVFRPVFVSFIGAMVLKTAVALTVNEQVTPQYVHEHPTEITVKVTQGKNGLIDFKVTRSLANPRYLVAHLSVHHHGRVIAESESPSFTRNRENTFYFSLAPEDVAESTFELGESAFTESEGEAVPVVGTTHRQFQLKDFVPEELLKQVREHQSDREGVTFPSLHVR